MESREEGPQFDESRYAAIVGRRAEHYLPRFRRFAKGEVFSWNWAAFFGTLAWLRYRRLYRWSWLYFFVSTPMLMIAWLVSPGWGDQCYAALDPATPYIKQAIEALIALSWVVPPLFADRLYFNVLRGRLAAPGIPKPSGWPTIAGALLLQGFVLFFGLASIAGYGGYQYRARIGEAVIRLSEARRPLYEYVTQNRRLPARLEDIVDTGPGGYVAKLDMIERGTIRATFNERLAHLAGHTIFAAPTWKGDEITGWSCGSYDLPRQCMPYRSRPVP